MAKKQKKMTEAEIAAAEEARVLEVCADLSAAKEIAATMWKDEQSPEIVFEVFDRLVIDGETNEDKAQDLLRAREVARELFAISADAVVTPVMVFGVFDRLDLEEEEDEDDGDE